MTSSSAKSLFWRGARDGLPFLLVVVPFALLFGVVATEAGLSVLQTMGFSVLVIAGASQFAAVQLMADNAPTLIVIATALAVNLRMAMYSASLAAHLGPAPLWQRAMIAYLNVDQSYVLSIAKFESQPALPVADKVRYFFGVVVPVFPAWYAASLVGAMIGERIPPEFALDFAVPITFIAVVAPMIRTLAHLAATLTSIAVALALSWVPYSAGLLVAGLAAMIVGAQVELIRGRKP